MPTLPAPEQERAETAAVPAAVIDKPAQVLPSVRDAASTASFACPGPVPAVANAIIRPVMPSAVLMAELPVAAASPLQPAPSNAPSTPATTGEIVPAAHMFGMPALPSPEHDAMTPDAEKRTFPIADIIPLEFYSARVKSTWTSDAVPVTPRIVLSYPAFRLGPVFVPEKQSRKRRSNVRSIDSHSASSREARWRVVKAVAAGLMIAAGLWSGVSLISSQFRASGPAGPDMASVTAPQPQVAVSAPQPKVALSAPQSAQPQQGGVFGAIRTAVSHRASAELSENFENGMKSWGTTSGAWAPGWSRHPDGYIRTGSLALFRPSMSYSSYRMEFMAQIDSKGLGWAVRAHDKQNYHAMKLAVLEPGLRPVIAMVHYPVVHGKPGKRVETPLNVMVHNNEAFLVTVEVKGDRIVTSVGGQEVDSWAGTERGEGGIGFFSEAGERARLYWMKVAVNNDVLGRVCGYLSNILGEGQTNTAALTGPAVEFASARVEYAHALSGARFSVPLAASAADAGGSLTSSNVGDMNWPQSRLSGPERRTAVSAYSWESLRPSETSAIRFKEQRSSRPWVS